MPWYSLVPVTFKLTVTAHRMVIGPRIGAVVRTTLMQKCGSTVDRTSLEEEAPSAEQCGWSCLSTALCQTKPHWWTWYGHDMDMIWSWSCCCIQETYHLFLEWLYMYNIPFDVVYKACTMLWHRDAWWQSVIDQLLMQSCLIDVVWCNCNWDHMVMSHGVHQWMLCSLCRPVRTALAALRSWHSWPRTWFASIVQRGVVRSPYFHAKSW